MISEGAALRALGKERSFWSHQLRTDYVDGIRKGLEIAIRIIKNVSRVSPESQAKWLARIHGWNSNRLFQAIRTTHHLLVLGNRKKAIERLQKEIAHNS